MLNAPLANKTIGAGVRDAEKSKYCRASNGSLYTANRT